MTQTCDDMVTVNAPPPCGTYAAYQRHVKRREPIDQACREANRRYMADWRSRDGQAQRRDRNHMRAREDQAARQGRQAQALLWLLRNGHRDVAIMLGLLPDDGTATA